MNGVEDCSSGDKELPFSKKGVWEDWEIDLVSIKTFDTGGERLTGYEIVEDRMHYGSGEAGEVENGKERVPMWTYINEVRCQKNGLHPN